MRDRLPDNLFQYNLLLRKKLFFLHNRDLNLYMLIAGSVHYNIGTHAALGGQYCDKVVVPTERSLTHYTILLTVVDRFLAVLTQARPRQVAQIS